MTQRLFVVASLDVEIGRLLAPVEAAGIAIGRQRDVVGIAERQAGDGGGAGGAAIEPDQEVGLVLEREVDLDAAVGGDGSRRPRSLTRRR